MKLQINKKEMSSLFNKAKWTFSAYMTKMCLKSL